MASRRRFAAALALATVALGLAYPATGFALPSDWDERSKAGVACLAALKTADDPSQLAPARQTAAQAAETALTVWRTRPAEWTCYETIADVCAEAARAPHNPQSQTVLAHLGVCIAHRRAGLAAGGVGVVGAEVVRSVAQVVVTKAQAAGWGVLVSKLKGLAHCEAGADASSTLRRTCEVLESLSIKDLVSSPMVLLTAAVHDLLEKMAASNAALGTETLTVVLAEITARWPYGGIDGLPAAAKAALMDLVQRSASGSCDPAAKISVKYAHVVGMCLIQHPPKQLSRCDVSPLIAACGAESQSALSRLWDLTTVLFPETAQPKATDAINLAFALAQAELDAPGGADKAVRQEYLTATKDLATGLVNKDWVAATSGGVRILELVAVHTDAAVATCEAEADANCKKAKATWDHSKALRLLAAIGNYALTFDKNVNADPAASAEAREKIITELVDRMVNRTDRDSGAVLSLGGTLGALGGARFADTDELHADWAFPLQLALGVGLQTYGSGDGGFHMLVSALDLGQYVSFNDELEVDTPDVESALQCGLTLGYWFALRETPLHVAAHASVAPFNRASGNPTFQLGAAFGIYVPLLDFN